jgi:hypothetical protein
LTPSSGNRARTGEQRDAILQIERASGDGLGVERRDEAVAAFGARRECAEFFDELRKLWRFLAPSLNCDTRIKLFLSLPNAVYSYTTGVAARRRYRLDEDDRAFDWVIAARAEEAQCVARREGADLVRRRSAVRCEELLDRGEFAVGEWFEMPSPNDCVMGDATPSNIA